MSDVSLEPGEVAAYVARLKAGWREHAQSLSWEEKIRAIERMRIREAALRVSREQYQAERRVQRGSGSGDA